MRVPLFPLPRVVLFPGAVLPLLIFEDRYKAMLKFCLSEPSPFGLVLQRENGSNESYSIGTLAQVIQVDERRDGNFNILIRGTERFRITALNRRGSPYSVADIEPYPDENVPTPALAMVAQRVSSLFDEYYREIVGIMGGWQREATPGERTWLFPEPEVLADRQKALLEGRSAGYADPTTAPSLAIPALPEDPTVLANTVAAELTVDADVKQDLLEAPTALARLQKEAEILTRETPNLEERKRLEYRRRFTTFGTMS